MDKNIELELRAEVSKAEQTELVKVLDQLGTLTAQTNRLLVMFFGSVQERQLDIRIRITNGDYELTLKSGPLHAHDRVEINQKIDRSQFIGLVKIFSQYNFSAEIGERQTLNYELAGDITVSLVTAGPIMYVELEKMSSESDKVENNAKLKQLAAGLKLRPLSELEFNDLCQRLADTVDHPFEGTAEGYIKLAELVRLYDKQNIEKTKNF